jgi:hypothetical protein
MMASPAPEVVSAARSLTPQVRAQTARIIAVGLIGAVAPAERTEAGITALPAIAIARLGRGNRSAENQSRCAGDDRGPDPASAIPASAVVRSAAPATSTPTASAAPTATSVASPAAVAATTETPTAAETTASSPPATTPLGQFYRALSKRLTARTKGSHCGDADQVRFVRNA